MVITDNETKVDLLNNEAIAATIVSLLRGRLDRPVTVGIHGDWGAGKSSVLEMVEAGLSKHPKALCLKFNGWRFQGFEDAKIALMEGVVEGLLERRPALTKASDAVKRVLKRLDWLKIAKSAGGLAFTAYTGIPSPGNVASALEACKSWLSDPAKLVATDPVAALGAMEGFLKPEGQSTNVAGEIQGFRDAFDDLLAAADIDQLVVLIDDLDRCLPETAIETLEAVRLFVFTSRTAFVVAADEAMIEHAVRRHFPDLPDTTGPRDYARNYLEKLIQVPFRIPALGDTETRIYVTLLLVGNALGEDDASFLRLVEAAKTLLKRPWLNAGLDAATIKAALGDLTPQVQEALLLSEQIGPILASGTHGNPRQIKRFLNGLLLRKQTANARGFGEEVKLPVLAKLMLAERFRTKMFDQIARGAARTPDGSFPDLAKLESAANEPAGSEGQKRPRTRSMRSEDGSDVPNVGPAGKGDPPNLTEWLASEEARAWARVQPPLGGVDLRPYLFVTRDRKDFFGPSSALGHLAGVVEKLLGPKLAVQGHSAELKKLSVDEAARVFEELRRRVMAGGEFGEEPPGVPGLVVLTRAHPSLQANLLDLLEALPEERLGPWVLTGWEGTLDATAKLRFDATVRRWAEVNGNPMLKTAAAAILRPGGLR